MRAFHFIVSGAVLAAGLLGAAPTFAATTRTFYMQTVAWASKDNPAQKRVVAKFGEVYGFVPGTIVVDQGDHVVLHIRNLEGGGDDGHTFTLPGYGINKSLPPLSTETVSFIAGKAGVFSFHCEFHKPWMSGELVVLPAK
ncbi:nitrous-oxide reductase [mine drainage metagenome]|uniref:Nitrous-oxide reductase n=1 Tax=mine drainage metagenome TaxID=410659 RepID=T0ZBP1_9ZZZZ